jgi:hypothetical protein
MKASAAAEDLHLPRRAVALALAGGRGSRLKNLTDNRAEPASLARVGLALAGLAAVRRRG